MEDYRYQMDGTLPLPTATATAEPIPLPTVTHTPPHFEHITDLGHRTLWVLFVLMLLSTIGFIVLSWRVAIPKRLFYQLTTYVTLISTFTYYAMATGGGWNLHPVWEKHEHKHDLPDTHNFVLRQVFWARYIDWLLTTPLILFNLGALAGVSGSNILNTIVANVALTLTGLFGIYSHGSKTKWGWYAMSWVAFLVVGWNLLTNARATAQRRGSNALYNPLALYTVTVWTGYLIIWGVSDIGRSLSPDGLTVAFAILDILAKPVFGVWLLLSNEKVSGAPVQVDGVWSEGFGHREGLLRVGDRDEDA
ncbi:Opsin-1 [Dactylellina cionopaga]|nr:Opsin-1 [Dactylellina cionopaga]